MKKRCVVSRRGREASKQKKQLERGGCRLCLNGAKVADEGVEGQAGSGGQAVPQQTLLRLTVHQTP